MNLYRTLSSPSTAISLDEIFIDDSRGETKGQASSQGTQPHPLATYPTPTSREGVETLIRLAELEPDPRMIKVYDEALAPFCQQQQAQTVLKDKQILFRVLRLDFPLSKSAYVDTTNARGQDQHSEDPVWLINDADSHLTSILRDELTKERLHLLRKKWSVNQREFPVEEKEASDDAEEFAKQLQQNQIQGLFLTEGKERSPVVAYLRGQKLEDLYLHLLFLLEEPGQDLGQIVDQSRLQSCQIIFDWLLKALTLDSENPELVHDLKWIALRHPTLLAQLGQENDQIRILCKSSVSAEGSAEFATLTGSRFLLATHSTLFRTYMEAYSEGGQEQSMIDLSQTSFDQNAIELLLNWISLKEGKFTPFDPLLKVADLQKLFVSIEGLQLINQKGFEEAICLELIRRLTPETVTEILGIGLNFHLGFLTNACLGYISRYPGGNLELSYADNGSIQIKQIAKGGDLPTGMYDAIRILQGRVESASLNTWQPEMAPGCFRRSYRNVATPIQCVNEKFGDLFIRVGVFALLILMSRKIADDDWRWGRDGGLAFGLGVIYPLVYLIFRMCVINPVVRNRTPFVVTLPQIVPMCAQRGVFSTQESIYARANQAVGSLRRQGVLREPMQLRHSPLFNALPPTLQKLSLEDARDLQDDDLIEIAARFKGLDEIALGSHPELTGRGVNALHTLNNITKLTFKWERGERPWALNQLDLSKVFQEDRKTQSLSTPSSIGVSLYDTTAIYFPPTFLRNVPGSVEVSVCYNHATMPRGRILFASHRRVGQDPLWPGTYESLVATIPKMRSLDLRMPVSDADLATILASAAPNPLRCLILDDGMNVNDQGLRAIADSCPSLEEISISTNGTITDQGILYLAERLLQLRKIRLKICTRLTDESLRYLAQIHALTSCVLEWMPNVTDRGIQHLLDREVPIEEIKTIYCDGISNGMLTRLFQREAGGLQHVMEQSMRLISKFASQSFPMHLISLNLPSLLFEAQFLLMHGFERVSAGLGLEASGQRRREAPLSFEEAAAKMYLEVGLNLDRMQPLSFFHSTFKFPPLSFMVFHMFSEPFRELHSAFTSRYKSLIAERFSGQYVEEMQQTIKAFQQNLKQQLEAEGGLLKRTLQTELSIGAYRGSLVSRWMRPEPNGAFAQIEALFFNFVADIKSAGERFHWDDEQRINALCAGLIFSFDLIAEALGHDVSFDHADRVPCLREQKEFKREIRG